MLPRLFLIIYKPSKYFLCNTESVRECLLPHDLSFCATMEIRQQQPCTPAAPTATTFWPTWTQSYSCDFQSLKKEIYNFPAIENLVFTLLIFHSGRVQKNIFVYFLVFVSLALKTLNSGVPMKDIL